MMGAKGSESEIMLMERMGSENGSGSSRKNNKDEDHNQTGRRERSCWKSSKSVSSSSSSSRPSLLSDPFYSPISERMERSKVDHMGGHSRRASTSSNHRLLQSDHHHFMQVDEKQGTPNRNPHNHHQTTRHAMKDVCHSLTTSKQLLKVLNRVWSIEEQKSTCISLFATLRSELDRACLQVSRLIQDRAVMAQSRHAEVDLILKRFEEEKAVWRMKEECRFQTAIAPLLSELKAERKLRKQAERLNKRLGRELCEANTSLAMSAKEVEAQKRAMQVLERVCEELARGGTEDNYNAAKLEEEEKKDKKSVEMKKMLNYPRLFEFEELKNELGSYLTQEDDVGAEGSLTWQSSSSNHDKLKALQKHFKETLPGGYPPPPPPPPPAGQDDKEEEEEEDEEEGEGEGELHCIELNMEEGNNGGMTFESGSSEAWRNDYEDEIERYNMIKDLRDHFVSSSKIPPS